MISVFNRSHLFFVPLETIIVVIKYIIFYFKQSVKGLDLLLILNKYISIPECVRAYTRTQTQLSLCRVSNPLQPRAQNPEGLIGLAYKPWDTG